MAGVVDVRGKSLVVEERQYDAIVCGSCVVDLLVRPLPLGQAIEPGRLYEVEPLRLETGGIVSNSGATLAKLGMRVGAFSFVGNDQFGEWIRSRYTTLGIDPVGLATHDSMATSTTAVLIDQGGERTFAHCVGAPRDLSFEWFERHQDYFAKSRAVILGYFSLMPRLEPDLPRLLAMLQDLGCLTVLETAGSGGTIERLAPSLPHVDIYIPSFQEAAEQTRQTEPEQILQVYRDQGAMGVVGVKLGSDGALLSPAAGQLISIAPVTPPGPVVDTTGAGDAFLAGYVAGTLKGLTPSESGQLAAAAGACCVTALGACEGLKNYEETSRLAGVHL